VNYHFNSLLNKEDSAQSKHNINWHYCI